MKIYTKVVMDIRTGKILEEELFEYQGPIAECKGGGSSTTTSTTNVYPDYAYNRRMATVAEKQLAQAEEYMTFWREYYQPMEKAEIAANMELIPAQTAAEKAKVGLEQAQAEAGMEMVPLEKEYRRGVLEAGIKETAAAEPVMSEYYKQALRGIDPEAEAARARADVATQFKGAEGTMRRSLGRVGLGARYGEAMAGMGMERARATAGAMTTTRRAAEEQNFQRLAGATQQFKGGILR